MTRAAYLSAADLCGRRCAALSRMSRQWIDAGRPGLALALAELARDYRLRGLRFLAAAVRR